MPPKKNEKENKSTLKFLDKIMEQIKKGQYTGLLILAGLGLSLIIAGNIFSVGSKNVYSEEPAIQVTAALQEEVYTSSIKKLTDQYRQDIEERLREILSKINGAGYVSVQITFSGTIENKYATDSDIRETVTDEVGKETQRNTKEMNKSEQVILTTPVTSNVLQSPVIIGEEVPEITGVLVVATGAFDPAVQIDLARACETLLGVPAHRVLVLAGTR